MNVSDHFREFDRHLTGDEKPSAFFNALAGSGEFPEDFPYSLLIKLKSVPQSPVYHPEGDVWNHTMLVTDNAAQRKTLSREPRVLMWAALLHDLGKITSTKVRNGKITAYEHDVEGEKLALSFLGECTKDDAFTGKVASLVKWHMQPLYVQKRLPFSNLTGMAAETDAGEVALLSLCDRLGRGGLSKKLIEEEIRNIVYFLNKCGRLNHKISREPYFTH